MKNHRNVFTLRENNIKSYLQLGVFALFAVMSLFSSQTLAQQNVCTPTTTVTEGDLAPGGIASFLVTSGPGSVTVDHVNAGTGLRSLTVVGTATNAAINIPAFTPGTFNPVTATFTVNNPNQAVDFTLRAASLFHAAFIRVRCAAVPTPTATPTPSPTPTITPTPTPAPQGCTRTQGYYQNNPEAWRVTSLRLGTVTYNQAQLLSILNEPVSGNGLISLAHQLIAAKLNVAAGASVPASVARAIADADALIGNRVAPPVGSGFLSTSSTASLTAILDAYNNGDTPGGPPHCDDNRRVKSK